MSDTPTVQGFSVAALDAGLYASFGKATRPDLTLVVSDRPCAAAGVFTTNLVKAAPVIVDQAYLSMNPNGIRAVLVNTASANACTGQEGFANAEACALKVSSVLQIAPKDVLLMSTGVIGTQLPMHQMKSGIEAVVSALSPHTWAEAARAIMTTDTKPKLANAEYRGANIVGIAKGAGMIAPNMATMLGLLVTDAQIGPDLLQTMLKQAAEVSFNRVVVDGDMSTNDTLLMLANGASGRLIAGEDIPRFQAALNQVCTQLALAIVRDGEGVTKFIKLRVTGARSAAEARQIGNTIATSALVKTAFYGGDPNWGRILAAAGRAGVMLDPMRLSLWYNDLQLVADGTPLNYDEARAKIHASQAEIEVQLELGLGEAEALLWTCDLSHDYVSINGHYRT